MPTQHFLSFFFFLLFSCNTLTSTSSPSFEKEETHHFVRSIDPKSLHQNNREKLSHFRFFWHDIMSGKNPTSVTVVPLPLKLNTSTSFGLVNIIDNPLTLGPKMTSKLVGNAQGFYASTSKDDFSLFMAMTFAFIEGNYNDSTITILGRNSALNKVREMPIVGGTGRFRFARGYAQTKTYQYETKSQDTTVEYNVYVFYY